jgi:hypothetical protein
MKLNLTPEQIEELKDRILNFGNFHWCECSECKYDCSSHAVDIDKSLQKLAEEVLKDEE